MTLAEARRIAQLVIASTSGRPDDQGIFQAAFARALLAEVRGAHKELVAENDRLRAEVARLKGGDA